MGTRFAWPVSSLEQLGKVRVGAMPYGVAVAPAGDRELVANQQSGSVFVIDAETLVVTHRIKVGRYPESRHPPQRQPGLCGQLDVGRHLGAQSRDREGA